MLRLPGFVVSIGVMRLEKRGSMAVSLSDVISASETGSNHCPGRPAPRLIQTLAHLPDVHAQAPDPSHVAAALPAIRRGPGQGERHQHRAKLPQGLSARIGEDSASVAGPALSDGQGRAGALAVAVGDRAVATAPRGIADCRSVTSRVWAPARRRTPIPRQTMRQHDGKRSLLKP